MKDLKNTSLLPEDFKGSTFFFANALLGFIAGILIFHSKYFNPLLFIFLLFLPVLLLFSEESSKFFVILLFLFFLCLGTLRSSYTFNTYEGVVQGKAYVSSFVKITKYDKRATLSVEESTKGILSKVEGRFDLKEKINLFDEIMFQGELRKPQRYKNIQSKTHVHEEMQENRRILKVSKLEMKSKNRFFEWLVGIREFLINQFEKIEWSGKNFFIEVIFGERVLDDSIRDIFSKTGTAHILSISGLHFALTVFFAYIIVYFLNFLLPSSVDLLPRQVFVIILSIPLLITYALLSGLSVPAMRALLFFLLSSIFLLFFKKSFNAFNLLFLVALIFVINDPNILTSISFQLSFLSVFALLVSFKFHKSLENRYEASLKNRILHYFISMMFISLTITLFILPVINSFTRQNLFATMLANPVVIPVFSFIILPFLFISLPFAFVSKNLFDAMLVVPNLGWKVIYNYLEFLVKKLPEVYLDFDFSLLSLIIYYLILLILFLTAKKIKWTMVVFGIFLILVFPDRPLKGPLLIFPDVGQGDCAVIKTEEGEIIFIDVGGNIWDENLGKKVYFPLMRKLGAKKVDFVIISHAHPDHSGVIDWLKRNYPVERVLTGEELISSKREILIKKGRWNIYILTGLDEGKENNKSSWVFVEYENYRMLFTGDTEKEGIGKMIKKYSNILKKDITLIKVPHHGASSSFHEDLYRRFGAKYAVITAGKGNPWNLPSNEVLKYLKEKNIKYFRTDEDGEIIMNLHDGKVITYKQYYGL